MKIKRNPTKPPPIENPQRRKTLTPPPNSLPSFLPYSKTFDFFNARGGIFISGNKTPSQREGSSRHMEGIIFFFITY